MNAARASGDKRDKARCRTVGHALESNSTVGFPGWTFDLDRYHYPGLAVGFPPVHAKFFATDESLINFDRTHKDIAAVTYRAPLELMQPSPRRLIAPEPELPLQTFSASTRLLCRNPPHGTQPFSKRFTRPMKECPACRRYLSAAITALHQTVLEQPIITGTTYWANEAFRPTHFNQVAQTR